MAESVGAGAGDPRFFARIGPHSLRVLAEVAGGVLADGADPERLIDSVAPLQSATASQVSFLDNRRYGPALDATLAGAVILAPSMQARVPAGTVAIVADDPYVGWARVAALFHPVPPVAPGIHPSAIIDATASVDASAQIGPFVVVGAAAEIGPRVRIGAMTSIGDGVQVGPDCRIGAQVTLSHCILGARVALFPGVRIGQEGFGFATTKAGFVSVPQLGRVLVGDDVEIGANTTIDRGSAQDTIIGHGCRIDNLVQVGHNVRLGRCCVLVSQVGISGSTVFDDFVVVAGQVGIAGHLHIGKGARLGGQAGVMGDVPAGAEFLGSPAMPVRAFFRQVATLRRLAEAGRAPRPKADLPTGAAVTETD